MASGMKRPQNRWTAGTLVVILMVLFAVAFSLMLTR
jgi:hypothetical protein